MTNGFYPSLSNSPVKMDLDDDDDDDLQAISLTLPSPLDSCSPSLPSFTKLHFTLLLLHQSLSSEPSHE